MGGDRNWEKWRQELKVMGGGGWELGDKRTRTGRKIEGNWEKREKRGQKPGNWEKNRVWATVANWRIVQCFVTAKGDSCKEARNSDFPAPLLSLHSHCFN